MNNPYVWNRIDTNLVYGRDALLKDLRGEPVGDPQHRWHSFGVAGGRRMGKTTLLRRVEQDLKDNIERLQKSGLWVIPIYIDGQRLPHSFSAPDIWGLLFSQLHSALKGNAQSSKPLDFDLFTAKVISILKDLEVDPRIFVMFDEIERILACDWSYSFLESWRGLLHNTPEIDKYFTVIFTGAREMGALQDDVTSPLANILEWKDLHSLNYEDACKLMQEPIDYQWSEPFLKRVYNETGGHPMLLQYVMQRICQTPLESADQSIEQIIKDVGPDHHWQFSQWWEKYCSTTAQQVYARLPDNGATLSLKTLTDEFGTNEANGAVKILQHVGLIAAEEDGFEFRYSGNMFRRWYSRYVILIKDPTSDLTLYDSHMHDKLKDISLDFAKSYISAWKIYEKEDIPDCSGTLHHVRDLLTNLLNRLAPHEAVKAEEDFQLESDQKYPTRQQRVRYIVQKKKGRSKNETKEIVSDFNIAADQLDKRAKSVTTTYGRTSGKAHNEPVVTREDAYRFLKQWESIFAQLL